MLPESENSEKQQEVEQEQRNVKNDTERKQKCNDGPTKTEELVNRKENRVR